jgi:hypothetical protein
VDRQSRGLARGAIGGDMRCGETLECLALRGASRAERVVVAWLRRSDPSLRSWVSVEDPVAAIATPTIATNTNASTSTS